MFRKLLMLSGMLLLLLPVSLAGQSRFDYSGVYTAWAQSQHNFTFTPNAYDHEYVVQMLRWNLSFAASENLSAITRFDLAQGWWGVDNALRSVQRTGTAGGSALFDFKDTNFLLHIDQAYIQFAVPTLPVNARVGRMWYGLGNRLLLDNNLDGIQVSVSNHLSLGWAKVSEGVDDLSDDSQVGADSRGNTDARDADIYTLTYTNKTGRLNYSAYGLHYFDASTRDRNAYIPDHLQYFKSRFSPQITRLSAIGIAGSVSGEMWSVEGEVDYLTGKDDIENTLYGAKQMWDKNNGDLRGYNLYLNATYAPGDALTFGAIFGVGSGDPDKRSGQGNVNKLRTSGFFYLTELWEDSIMPDEEGITPQGLGAPNVRGYRELENTTAFQVNGSLSFTDNVSGFAAYTYLRATQPIQAWMPNGSGDWRILDASASDIGQEIDFRLSYNMYQELNLTLRGGYFLPGTGAAYLINGNNDNMENAWELKGTVTYRF